jgi:hypothetical protein
MPTLGGITWCHNAVEFDYPIIGAIQCLQELCDQVIVLDAGSTDGSDKLIDTLSDPITNIVKVSNTEWHKHQGREKLSFFQNLAKSFLTTDYYFCLQADEVIHENSFSTIRTAIGTGREGFFCSRINLWGDSGHYLHVSQERQPVGIYVTRLARQYYNSIDDGESIQVNEPDGNFVDKINIYHVGFVRDNQKHLVKIRHIQDEVFKIEHDKRIDGMVKFDPWKFYDKSDVSPIKERLPKFIQAWAKERDEINAK